MTDRRFGCVAAFLGGYLYVCGGANGKEVLSSVERYDPLLNQWDPVTPMLAERVRPGIAVSRLVPLAAPGARLEEESDKDEDDQLWKEMGAKVMAEEDEDDDESEELHMCIACGCAEAV